MLFEKHFIFHLQIHEINQCLCNAIKHDKYVYRVHHLIIVLYSRLFICHVQPYLFSYFLCELDKTCIIHHLQLMLILFLMVLLHSSNNVIKCSFLEHQLPIRYI